MVRPAILLGGMGALCLSGCGPSESQIQLKRGEVDAASQRVESSLAEAERKVAEAEAKAARATELACESALIDGLESIEAVREDFAGRVTDARREFEIAADQLDGMIEEREAMAQRLAGLGDMATLVGTAIGGPAGVGIAGIGGYLVVRNRERKKATEAIAGAIEQAKAVDPSLGGVLKGKAGTVIKGVLESHGLEQLIESARRQHAARQVQAEAVKLGNGGV